MPLMYEFEDRYENNNNTEKHGLVKFYSLGHSNSDFNSLKVPWIIYHKIVFHEGGDNF